MKKFSLAILLLFLCAFNKNDYKIENIENDGVNFKFYIPKDFCRFELKSNEEFMLKISNGGDKSTTYAYIKCSDVEKINSNKDFDDEEAIQITLPKFNVLPLFSNKVVAKMSCKYDPDIEKASRKSLKDKLLKININEELNKENFSDRDKRFIKRNIEQTISYISEDTRDNYAIIDGNCIESNQYKFDNENYIRNGFDGLIGGFLTIISYQSKNENFRLANPKDFAEYIRETQLLNQPQINTYFTMGNQILNIKAPNFGDFFDVSNLKVLNKFWHQKMFLENKKYGKDSPVIFIGVNLADSRFNENEFFEMMKKAFPNGNVEMKNDGKYKYIRVYKKVDGKEIISYYYLFDIGNFKLFTTTMLFYQKGNITIKEEKRMQKITKKYIKYLEKVNK